MARGMVPYIWRDDDVLQNEHAGLDHLLRIDDLFQIRDVPHTIAVLATTLHSSWVIPVRDRKMIPQLHGWAHDDHSLPNNRALLRLAGAKKAVEDAFGQRIDTFYPPWNRTSPELDEACREIGLTVSFKKITITDFLNPTKRLLYGKIQVVNFHYWADECKHLAAALDAYVAGLKGLSK